MSINRHNYETFFLLYVDNELSPAERKAVEIFVQENADLRTELQLLLATTLPDETIVYESPEGLYKESGVDAMQENLLLYLDNELDVDTSALIAAGISSDNQLKKEWDILQKTKLNADEQVIFKDKKILYRHEKARVVSIRFWRIAAAAAIIIALLFTGISLLRKSGTAEDPLVQNNTTPLQEQKNKSNNINKDPIQSTQDNNNGDNKIAQQAGNENKKPAGDLQRKVAQQNRDNSSNNELVNKQTSPIHNSSLQKKIPLENINKETSNETIASAVLKKRSDIVYVNKAPDEIANTSVKEKITAPAAPIIDYNSVPAMPDSYAKTTALNEVPENNDQIFYMSEERVSKSRIGGLFRKVKRVIERSTNLKTGNGVKIGGFEIALK